jgi:hypothetical protein
VRGPRVTNVQLFVNKVGLKRLDFGYTLCIDRLQSRIQVLVGATTVLVLESLQESRTQALSAEPRHKYNRCSPSLCESLKPVDVYCSASIATDCTARMDSIIALALVALVAAEHD